eukprot:scaffold262226_cov18-Tisochrysis_lutea.AAC.1
MESTAGKGDEKVEGGDKRETGRKEGRKASDGVQGKAGAERSADRGQGVAVGHDAAKVSLVVMASADLCWRQGL